MTYNNIILHIFDTKILINLLNLVNKEKYIIVFIFPPFPSIRKTKGKHKSERNGIV